jgi:putative transposase
VLLDVFSRYAVGWMLAQRESASLAEKLIAESCERQKISPGQLTVHADRGAAMTSKPVALLLADLGVTKSHSRPQVSNDNPFSESQFKTMKYRPNFPHRFGSLEHARSFCGDFFPWYNTEHHHVGLGLFTPHDVHYGLAAVKGKQRARVLAEAFARHPERFPNGRPSPRPLPTAVWINPPKTRSDGEEVVTTMTPESNPITIEAVRSSCDADLEHERPGILPGSFSGLGREESAGRGAG